MNAKPDQLTEYEAKFLADIEVNGKFNIENGMIGVITSKSKIDILIAIKGSDGFRSQKVSEMINRGYKKFKLFELANNPNQESPYIISAQRDLRQIIIDEAAQSPNKLTEYEIAFFQKLEGQRFDKDSAGTIAIANCSRADLCILQAIGGCGPLRSNALNEFLRKGYTATLGRPSYGGRSYPGVGV